MHDDKDGDCWRKSPIALQHLKFYHRERVLLGTNPDIYLKWVLGRGDVDIPITIQGVRLPVQR